MIFYIELLLCVIYIIPIIIIAIIIKPTWVIAFILGIYTFITTSMIYNYGKCKKFKTLKNLFIILYSILCMVAFYTIHRVYYFYPRYKLYLFALPIVYFVIIKMFEQVFMCEDGSVANFGIQFFLVILQTIKNIKNRIT